MPTIYKPPKKKRQEYIQNKTERRKTRIKFYNTQEWRTKRKLYISEHPCCERCREKGILRIAEDVHHINGFLNKDGSIDWARALDDKNLMALCKDCHAEIHAHKIKYEKPLTDYDDIHYNIELL